MKVIFCKNCHRKIDVPKFLPKVTVSGAINLECGFCKCKNKYVHGKKEEVKENG